jgi:hypothetical protein
MLVDRPNRASREDSDRARNLHTRLLAQDAEIARYFQNRSV